MELSTRTAFVLGQAITGYLSEYNVTEEGQQILVDIARQLEEEFKLAIPIPEVWIPEELIPF